jgi:hypothetical protein
MNTILLFHHLKLALPHKNGDVEMISYRDLLYMIYDKPYTTFYYMEHGKVRKCILKISLTYLEKNLPEVFFRCSFTVILNLCHFRKYEHARKVIVMENGMEFLMSRRKNRTFKSKIVSLPRLSPLCEPCRVCIHVCQVRDTFCHQTKKVTK